MAGSITVSTKPHRDIAVCVVWLQKCGMAATIIGMLADVNLFWEYDNRETLMQRDKEDPGK